MESEQLVLLYNAVDSYFFRIEQLGVNTNFPSLKESLKGSFAGSVSESVPAGTTLKNFKFYLTTPERSTLRLWVELDGEGYLLTLHLPAKRFPKV